MFGVQQKMRAGSALEWGCPLHLQRTRGGEKADEVLNIEYSVMIANYYSGTMSGGMQGRTIERRKPTHLNTVQATVGFQFNGYVRSYQISILIIERYSLAKRPSVQQGFINPFLFDHRFWCDRTSNSFWTLAYVYEFCVKRPCVTRQARKQVIIGQ